MKLSRQNLKLLVKQVILEEREKPRYQQDEEDKNDKELTWKKITDNLTDEGFRLLIIKALKDANEDDSEFLSDMFETLTKEEDREVQQIIVKHVEKIYKQSDM